MIKMIEQDSKWTIDLMALEAAIPDPWKESSTAPSLHNASVQIPL
jgi:hypothetical protein